MANEVTVLSLVDEISKTLDDKKTVVQIRNSKDDNLKFLELKSGSWHSDEPWIVVDENEKLYTMISLESVNRILQSYKDSMDENFQLKLEKVIWKNVPVDFQDVWAVAMDEIRKIAKSQSNNKVLNIDLESLIKKIKLKHPNLFIDMKDLSMLRDIR